MEVFQDRALCSGCSCGKASLIWRGMEVQAESIRSLLMSEGRSCGDAYGGKLRDRSLIRLMVERQGFRHVFSQSLNSSFVPRMCGEKFMGLLAA